MSTVTDEILPKIRAAFETALDVDGESITPETKPTDIPAWDSMGHVAVVSSLERAFGLSFDVDEVMAMENVREIIRIVDAKMAKLAV